MRRLSQIDANLLVALDVLLEERHVTRAARRLGVTQSAMSQTLRRLRETLDDPILVRSGGQMVTTPRAEALCAPLRNALRALEQTLNTAEPFAPASARRRFLFSCLDMYALNFVPELFSLLATAGEGLELDVLPLSLDTLFEQLRHGDVELAIVGPRDFPGDIHAEPVMGERMLSLVRVGHPILDGPITPEAYVSWPHVVFRLTGRGDHPIDRRLAELGLKRRIVGRSPYFLAAASVVVDSDLIVTVPRSVACAFARRWPLALFAPPLDEIAYQVYQAWPCYLDADPGHQWLRAQVTAIGAALTAAAPSCPLAPGQAKGADSPGCA